MRVYTHEMCVIYERSCVMYAYPACIWIRAYVSYLQMCWPEYRMIVVVCRPTYTYVVYACVDIYLCERGHVWVCVLSTCVCVCMYACMYVCVYVYMYCASNVHTVFCLSSYPLMSIKDLWREMTVYRIHFWRHIGSCCASYNTLKQSSWLTKCFPLRPPVFRLKKRTASQRKLRSIFGITCGSFGPTFVVRVKKDKFSAVIWNSVFSWELRVKLCSFQTFSIQLRKTAVRG